MYSYYTIPRTVRELQRGCEKVHRMFDYTIPRTVRELQHVAQAGVFLAQLYHTKNCQGATTSIAMLQSGLSIIPYQELSGSYNGLSHDNQALHYYTIPRTVRELQHASITSLAALHYTIPRTVSNTKQSMDNLNSHIVP